MKPRQLLSSRSGFTLIELLVVIAIIALLAAILFPVFARARENARKNSCLNNLKQIGVGIAQYTQDFDERYPMSEAATGSGDTGTIATIWDPIYWPFRVFPYIKNRQVFICPSTRPTGTANTDNSTSYWIVGGLIRKPAGNPVAIADVDRPAQAPHIFDHLDGFHETRLVFRPRYQSATQYDPGIPMNVASSTFRVGLGRRPVHLEGQNVLYADSHAKYVKPEVLFVQACPEYPSGTNCTPPAGF